MVRKESRGQDKLTRRIKEPVAEGRFITKMGPLRGRSVRFLGKILTKCEFLVKKEGKLLVISEKSSTFADEKWETFAIFPTFDNKL